MTRVGEATKRRMTERRIVRKYTEKNKYEAVALYKLLGSLQLVSNNLNIPFETLKSWHKQEWWGDYERDIAHSDRSKISGKLLSIRDKAVAVVEDRLENGDYVYNFKSGTVVRKPVDAKVASKILTDSIDRQLLIDKLNQEKRTESTTEKILARLDVLKDQFQKLAQTGLKRPLSGFEVIDGILVQPEENEHVEIQQQIALRPEGQDSTEDSGQGEASTHESPLGRSESPLGRSEVVHGEG